MTVEQRQPVIGGWSRRAIENSRLELQGREGGGESLLSQVLLMVSCFLQQGHNSEASSYSVTNWGQVFKCVRIWGTFEPLQML